MATAETINVYGIPDMSPEDELRLQRQRNGEVYAYMVKLIEAEKINPDSSLHDDYDGYARYEWMKKIATCDTSVPLRESLIELFEKSEPE